MSFKRLMMRCGASLLVSFQEVFGLVPDNYVDFDKLEQEKKSEPKHTTWLRLDGSRFPVGEIPQERWEALGIDTFPNHPLRRSR